MLIDEFQIQEEDVIVYYIDKNNIRQEINSDKALREYINIISSFPDCFLYIDKVEKLVNIDELNPFTDINRRHEFSFQRIETNTNQCYTENIFNDESLGNYRDITDITENSDSNESILLLLSKVMNSVDNFKHTFSAKIEALALVQQKILEDIEMIKSKNDHQTDKIDRLTEETSESINNLKVLLKNNHKDLSSALNQVEVSNKHEKGEISNKSEKIEQDKSIIVEENASSDQKAKEDKGKLINFEYAACCKCNSCPIMDEIYKCTECDWFILCKLCHISTSHKHFLHIIEPEVDTSIFKSQIELSISNLLQQQDENAEYRLSQMLNQETINASIDFNSIKPIEELRKAATYGNQIKFMQKKLEIKSNNTNTVNIHSDESYTDFNTFINNKAHIM